MSVFDMEALLLDLDADSPVGEDLEYDPGFVEMEALSTVGGEQSMVEGAGESEAEPADWKGVKENALELLGRSKDIRVAVYLARSLAACDGIPGFRDAICLLRGLLERYWEVVHPQLDPEDDNDPTLRINTIATLCGKLETLDILASAPLVISAKVGNVSYRDLQIANGELTASGGDSSAPTKSLIAAACQDSDLESLETMALAITECTGALEAIDQLLVDKVGSSQAPDLQLLKDMLSGMGSFLSAELVKRGVVEPDEKDGAGDASESVSTNKQNQHASGEILSRADAMRMMDKIAQYYLDNEPSSPIPLLMQRAKRLSNMDFMSILKDLAPNGIGQVEAVAGSSAPDQGSQE